MIDKQRLEIEEMFFAAVASASPERVVPKYLEMNSGESIRIGDKLFSLPKTGVFLIAIGKASISMASAAEKAIGDHFSGGIVVSKTQDNAEHLQSKVMIGSHPIPDNRSILAGEEVLAFADLVPEGALVLCLISGGGSSLVESPVASIQLENIQEITETLLLNGATINEINAVRSRLSNIKGGGLLGRLSQASVHNLIISDVIGDNPQIVASGPTVQSQLISDSDVEDILISSGLKISSQGKAGSDVGPVQTIIIANVSTAIEAAAKKSAQLGYSPVILSGSIQGEAREVATAFASIATDTVRGLTSFSSGTCLIAGGETTVSVTGDGVGGRNTEAALAASLAMSGVPGVIAGFLTTDGDDGMSGVAGAIVNGATIHEGNIQDAKRALRNNDSYTFLDRLGASVRSGPTGTNVNDLWVALVGDPKRSSTQRSVTRVSDVRSL